MPEIGTSGSMSGDGKRSDGQMAQATAPILDFTIARLHRHVRSDVGFGAKADISAFTRVFDARSARPRASSTRYGPNGP